MAKDPAFLFYPNDYIGGTMGMTFEEKGAYIELLMLQFNRGHMTEHMAGQIVGQIWVKIKDKFKIDDKGLYYNERLDLEIEKRKSFVDSRKNNLLGVNQYTKKSGHKKGHMTNHMENRDVNENVIKKEIVYPFDSENFKTAWLAWKRYKKEEYKFNYKSELSEQGALTELDNLAGHDEKKAIDIISQSIKKGWKGFFQLDNSKGNNNISDSYKQELIERTKGINLNVK